LAPMPAWLSALLRPPRPAPPTAYESPITPDSPYVRAAVEGEVANIMAATQGSRNTTLHAAAVKLGTLVGAGLLTEYEAAAVLVEAARASGYVGDDGEPQARKTISSGLRWGIAHPREVPR
jgi:hypothetical protein